MSRDIEIARELAASLTEAAPIGRIRAVEFTYFPFSEADRITADPRVMLSPNTLNRTRVSRQSWAREFSLLLTMVVEQSPNAAERIFDEYLESWDRLIDRISTFEGSITEIEQTLRYAIEPIQTHSRLIVQAILNYENR